jgi:UDP-2,4-diacetamido-2,4,6-trideoxy-beta-L-altropyranose hydrolase
MKFLFRVDASAIIGSGHLMRCFALAQMLRDERQDVHFATINLAQDIATRMQDEGIIIHSMPALVDETSDFDAVVKIADKIGVDWLVIDGAKFSGEYEQNIRLSQNLKVLRIVDLPLIHHYCDVLLNQNYGSEKMGFSSEPYTRHIFGLQNVLLRREFRKLSSAPVINGNGDKILVSLGGGTVFADQASIKIIEVLNGVELPNLEVTFIAGKLSSNVTGLRQMLRHDFEFKISSNNMASELQRASVAVVSGGATMWELIYLGIPYMAVALTPEQERYLTLLHEEGVCFYLGSSGTMDIHLARESLVKFIKNSERLLATRVLYAKLMDHSQIGMELMSAIL